MAKAPGGYRSRLIHRSAAVLYPEFLSVAYAGVELIVRHFSDIDAPQSPVKSQANCKTVLILPKVFYEFKLLCRMAGGRGGIRTHGRLAPTAVFKTAALNHSATLPRHSPEHLRT